MAAAFVHILWRSRTILNVLKISNIQNSYTPSICLEHDTPETQAWQGYSVADTGDSLLTTAIRFAGAEQGEVVAVPGRGTRHNAYPLTFGSD